jgi:hypothetical protein
VSVVSVSIFMGKLAKISDIVSISPFSVSRNQNVSQVLPPMLFSMYINSHNGKFHRALFFVRSSTRPTVHVHHRRKLHEARNAPVLESSDVVPLGGSAGDWSDRGRGRREV